VVSIRISVNDEVQTVWRIEFVSQSKCYSEVLVRNRWKSLETSVRLA